MHETWCEYLTKDACGTNTVYTLCMGDLVRIVRRRLIFNSKPLTRILKSQCPSMSIPYMSDTNSPKSVS